MPVPRFWQRIERRYKSGASHQFLLYSNIDDYIWDDVYGYLSTKDYLMEQMNRLGCNSILTYSRSEGILFPNLGIRDAYQKEFGLARIDDELEPIPEDMPKYNRLNADFRHVGEEGLIRDTQDALVQLENTLKHIRGDATVGLVIGDVDKLAPNRTLSPISQQIRDEHVLEAETLQRWATDMQIKLRRHMILLLTENPSNVAPELLVNNGRETHPVILPLPGYDERLAYIRHLLNLFEEEDAKEEDRWKLSLPDGTLSEDFARMTHGLTLKDIQNLWLTSRRRKTAVSFNMVVRQNRLSIPARSYGKLEIMYGQHGLNVVGGIDNTIAYMKDAIQTMKGEDLKRVPSGVLMIGPPGTGKTMLMNALGRDMGIHIVRLKEVCSSDPHMRSKWDILRALDAIHSMVPVIVFIDDIDKIRYATAENQEGKLTNQLIDRLLRSISDPSLRGKVLWVAASNKPDMIHPIFRKRGIFDDVIPFLLPGDKEKEDILKKMFSKNAIPYDNRINFSTPAGRVSCCTGADLEVIATRSYRNARQTDKDTVTEQDLVKAADEFISDYDPLICEYMTLLALKHANLTSLVSESLDAGIRKQIYVDKKLNRAKINQRINELRPQVGLRRNRG